MKDLVLVGSGGCMREILWQIWELGSEHKEWNVIGYVDNRKSEGNEDCYIGDKCCPYLGDDTWLLKQTKNVNVAICVGSPSLRWKIFRKISINKLLIFPTLVLGDASICSDAQIGRGCIISNGSRVSTNVSMGEFVFLNMDTMVCHDGTIGNFVTLSPGVRLAGAVNVGEMVDIGLSASVIQGVYIGNNVKIGAGGVVIRDIEDNCTAVGVPTRVISR